MADLHLPNVAEPIAALVEPPTFDTLVSRAHDRRRHQLLAGAVVAVVVVLAVIATTALATRSSTAPPVHPPPTPTPTTSAKGVDADTIVRDGDFLTYSLGADGTLLTTWRKCDQTTSLCKDAWLLQRDGEKHTGLLSGELPFVYPAGSDFVIATEKTRKILHPDGRITPVRRVGHLDPRQGDALVQLINHSVLIVDPVAAHEAAFPRIPGAFGDSEPATIAADGTVFAVSSLPPAGDPAGTQVAVFRGGSWRTIALSSAKAEGPVAGFITTSGDHVAAIATYDGATIAPLGTLGVSDDAGATWTLMHKSDLPFHAVDSVASTSTGTLFLATPDGRLYRSAGGDWTRFVRVALPDDDVSSLQPAGSEVRALSGGGETLRLLTFDDRGNRRDIGPVR